MKRKLLAGLLIAALLCGLPGTALAAVVDHDLSGGSLEITQENCNEDGYRVYQSGAEPTSNVISVGTGVVTHIVLDGVNIQSGQGQNGIDVADGAELTLALQGDNAVKSTDYTQAAVHVKDGSLTIVGDGSLDAATTNADGHDGEAAAIGTNGSENFGGAIAIGGSAQVTAGTATYGAAIGAGDYGGVTETGRITIGGSANVTAIGAGDGAGIGSAYEGDMNGLIHITGNAVVTAVSGSGDGGGAGIGAGAYANLGGTVRIDGSAQVTADGGEDAAGIGAGSDGAVSETGRILIGGSATVIASGNCEGAGIGAGMDEEMAGTIVISGRANVTAYGGDCAAAIGADDEGDMTGTIQILDGAVVFTGVKDDDGNVMQGQLGTIGGGQDFTTEDPYGTYILSPHAVLNGIPVRELERLLDAGFLNVCIDEAGNVVNLTIQEGQGAGSRYIWNEDRTICAGPLPAGAQAIVDVTLARDSADWRVLTKDAQGEIYRVFRMWFASGVHEDFPAFFHLGRECAGRTVELRALIDDELTVQSAVADEEGIVEFLIPKMGSFALILK